ncbi:MAG: hypothetical protein LBR09_00695 [Endomicrobium sp.]|nr:hypothetical protein [Endomicrobium sp.]
MLKKIGNKGIRKENSIMTGGVVFIRMSYLYVHFGTIVLGGARNEGNHKMITLPKTHYCKGRR